MHITKGDTFQLAIGWLDESIYGEGGLFIAFGFYYLNFWDRYDED